MWDLARLLFPIMKHFPAKVYDFFSSRLTPSWVFKVGVIAAGSSIKIHQGSQMYLLNEADCQHLWLSSASFFGATRNAVLTDVTSKSTVKVLNADSPPA